MIGKYDLDNWIGRIARHKDISQLDLYQLIFQEHWFPIWQRLDTWNKMFSFKKWKYLIGWSNDIEFGKSGICPVQSSSSNRLFLTPLFSRLFGVMYHTAKQKFECWVWRYDTTLMSSINLLDETVAPPFDIFNNFESNFCIFLSILTLCHFSKGAFT